MANTKSRSPVRAEKSKKNTLDDHGLASKNSSGKDLKKPEHSRDSFRKMKKQGFILFCFYIVGYHQFIGILKTPKRTRSDHID